MQRGMGRLWMITGIFMALLYVPLSSSPAVAAEAPCKVLVVMSYHDNYVWQQEVRQGIEQGIAKKCEIAYFNLNARIAPEKTAEKAKEAYEFFLHYQPTGVIASDDAAQIHFVVPYLKDKTSIPVVFIGVNNEASDYGYPAPNVTGVVERFHIHETLALLKQLMPKVETIAFLGRGNEPSTRGTFNQIKAEMERYPVRVVSILEPATYEEALKMAEDLKGKADAIYVEQVEGIKDAAGRAYSNKEVIRAIADLWGSKPLICGQTYSVRYGCLCTVVESGFEQGSIGTKMLLRIMSGTPVNRIPLTRNYTGFKVINASVVKKLGLMPPPIVLRGAKLVTNED